MPPQEMPNPIELYERAVNAMRPLIAGVKPEQLGNPTPCSEWTVQELLNHNINVARVLARVLEGVLTESGAAATPATTPSDPLGNPQSAPPVDPMAVSGPLPPEGAAAAFESSTAATLNAVKAPGMVEKVLDTPFGPMPAGDMLLAGFGDVLIHQWDLAKATGQDFALDDSLAAICRQVMGSQMEQGRQAGAFGPAVAVPDDSSEGDKLLGFAGRQP